MGCVESNGEITANIRHLALQDYRVPSEYVP